MNSITWEKNGNFDGGGDPYTMEKLPFLLRSSDKFPCQNADLNSNQILISDLQGEKHSNQRQHIDINVSPNHNSHREKNLGLNSPASVFNSSLHQKDLSYDDLSKNIDANLAEIDMETFRSEDINSILALPAIYSGHFDSVNHGEQCASVSGSLLNGLEIETSVSNRISEDEISICKDEPLFSPQREPAVHERTISVDSLDNSSSYDQDLVLTCKANKNNYTIVFEGSETQFSEDFEFQNGLRSSTSEETTSDNSYTSNSMIQSDLVFTTWSNLKRSHLGKKRRKFQHEISTKSKSLPNLNYQSVYLNDKVWQWAKIRGSRNFPFPDLDHFPSSNLQITRKCNYPYTLSLVKLFMKYKVSSRSSVFSSEHSGSTNSLIVHSLNNINHSSQNSTSKTETKEYKNSDADLTNQNYNIKNHIGLENLNSNQKRQLYVDNIKILDWHPTQNVVESNNNTNSFPSNCKLHNTSILKESNVTSPNGECDNSQYFEDSLMEAPILQVKNFNTMPIKEEEETDISSGDEIMKTSMSSDCNNCSSSSIDAVVIKNNTLELVSNTTRSDVDHNLDRIINIFPSSKPNVLPVARFSVEVGASPSIDDNQTQGTQTKQYNSKNCVNVDEIFPPENGSPKFTTQKVPVERCARHICGSREGSPNSSGYVSSRHSSMERLQRSSLGSGEVVTKVAPIISTKNVLTTRNCSTQVPVHVRDGSMQTSTLTLSHPNVGFLLTKSSKGDAFPLAHISDRNAKSDNATFFSSNKLHTKEDKCIYVCFPNYSLPDLSFLNSIASENSNSVFLSPTKFKPCSKILQTSANRPKSSEELDSQRLSNIKDWESLSVLLPDNLKHLLSQMNLKDSKPPSTANVSVIAESKSFPSSKTDSPSSIEPDKKRLPLNTLKPCSFNLRNRNVPLFSLTDCLSPTASWKGYTQLGTKIKAQSSPSCICQQCAQGANMPCDALKSSAALDHLEKNISCHSICKVTTCCDLKPKSNANSSSKAETLHSCSRHMQKSSMSGYRQVESKVVSDVTSGSKYSVASHSKTLTEEDQQPLYAASCKSKAAPSSENNIFQNMDMGFCQNLSFKDVKSTSEQKFGIVDLNHSHYEQLRRKGYDHINSDFFDMEKASQEFLVSPVQNSPYPISPDSYQMQSSSTNGNIAFQESLKRKTGLVENLQKATVLIIQEHSRSFKHDIPCFTSLSVGQKILTSLCPAVHTILSDGLLPSVQGFFGPLPNSPWKVTETSVQLDEGKKEVQELLKQVASEKLLTDSTYKFNAFIMGLLNAGSLEWWLGHLLSSQSLISHHYHPTALLSLLSLAASSHLKQELMELVSPLTNLTFNLDLTFETRIAAAKSHNKCSNNCCSLNKNKSTEDHNQNKVLSFNLCSSHIGQENNCKGESKQNYNPDKLYSSKHQLKTNSQDDPVWLGVTVNPFPNACPNKSSDQFPSMSPRKIMHPKLPESSRYEAPQKACNGVKEKGAKKHVADFSLCSSTDSGCSSQVCQSHDISSVATDSGESESHGSSKPDGQQFRQLQQKWEKITLGVEKQSISKKVPSSTGLGSHLPSKKSSDINQNKKASRCQVRIAPSEDSFKGSKSNAAKRAASQPPSNKLHPKTHSEHSYERKLQTPDVISSKMTIDRKHRSNIPTLKATKNLQPKSKIPIQKSGTRTQSSNKDSRNISQH